MGNLIDYLNRLENAVFDACLAPPGMLGEGAQLVTVALAIGVAASLVFNGLLNRARLEDARRDLRACLLEIWLYRHEPGVLLRAEWELVRANGRYVRALFPPLLVAVLIVSPLVLQSYHRFGLLPIPSGSDILLTAELTAVAARGDRTGAMPELVWARGRGEVTATVRKPSVAQIVWRLRPLEPGIHALHLVRGAHLEPFPLHVGPAGGESVTQARERSPWRALVQPRGAVLARDSGLRRIFVEYPKASPGWLVRLTVISLIAAMATLRLVPRRTPSGRGQPGGGSHK